MTDLPESILGEITAITITTPDLEQSFTFYKKLGFAEVFRADWPFSWIQISDGALLIMLRKDPEPYIALTYYVKDIEKVVRNLEKKGIKFVQKPKKSSVIKRYMFTSPDGLNISLVNIVDGFHAPSGPGMLTMPQEDYFKPEKYINKVCGLFGELAHPVIDLDKSIAYWELLGFKVISRFNAPYPWAIISDGLGIVGIHQTAHFDYPAITYFAADMRDKIMKLKEGGLTGYTEQGSSDIIIKTPEQQHLFLFSLGMPQPPAKKKQNNVHLPVIETKRLLLRELNPALMKEIFTAYSDEEIMHHMGIPTLEALETERNNFYQGMTTYRTSFKTFLMVDREGGKIIGRCGFHNWYAIHNRAELGYIMSDDTARGKGFMKEAARAVIKHGFEQMGLYRVEAFVGPNNVPSLKLIKGCGFIEEGTLRLHFNRDGIREDSICFSMLRPEYDLIKTLWFIS